MPKEENKMKRTEAWDDGKKVKEMNVIAIKCEDESIKNDIILFNEESFINNK